MSTATETFPETLSAVTLPLSTVESVRLSLTNNWTGVDELPFELIGERVMEIEADGPGGKESGSLTVSFGKPVFLEGKGWACVFKMSALGRNHVSPARGMDAVDALQAAFTQVGKQLVGMGRMHRITLGGSDDLGFMPASSEAPRAAGCPVMNGSLSL